MGNMKDYVEKLHRLTDGAYFVPVHISKHEGKFRKPPARMSTGERFSQELYVTEGLEVTDAFDQERFSEPINGLGLALGAAYGNYCTFDIDTKYLKPEDRGAFFETFKETLTEIDPENAEELLRCVWSTISGGFAVPFKLLSDWDENHNPGIVYIAGKAVVELRTDRYQICPPTHGYKWQTKKKWKIAELGLDALKLIIQGLTDKLSEGKPEKRKRILYQPEPRVVKKTRRDITPSAHFCSENDIYEVLESIGYTVERKIKSIRETHQEEGHPIQTGTAMHPNEATEPVSGKIYEKLIQTKKSSYVKQYYVEYAQNGLFSNVREQQLRASWVYALAHGVEPDQDEIDIFLHRKNWGNLDKSVKVQTRFMETIYLEYCNQHAVYYDTFSQTAWYYPHDDSEVEDSERLRKPVDSVFESTVRKYLRDNNCDLTRQDYGMFMNSAPTYLENKNIPFDYLKLCREQWNGEPVLEKIWQYIEIDESFYQTEEQLQLMKDLFIRGLVQMVAQIIKSTQDKELGLATDLVPSLLSKNHGIGKTRFYREFLFQDKMLSRYCRDSMPSKPDDQELALKHSLVVIDDEGFGMSRSEAERFKALVNRKKITYRVLFTQSEATFARRAVILLSSNNLKLIRDTHNRRFVPLAITSINLPELIAEINVRDFWADMFDRVEKNPYIIYTTSDENKLMDLASKEFMNVNPLHEFLDSELKLIQGRKPAKGNIRVQITGNNLFRFMKNQHIETSPTGLGLAMNERHFHKKRTKKGQMYSFDITEKYKMYLNPFAYSIVDP